MSNSKRIAKNTFFLYIRMFLTMGVGLYTSRIVLNTLGVEDYGIYSIVGGVVALFSFFNSAMSSATQRYLAFDIGKEDFEKLNKTFNTTFIIHIGIAIGILLFAETIGLWYVNFKLNVPHERLSAINWVYQFSVLTSLIGVMQVPFNALIIARERMNVFALISIVDVTLKLLIVYLLVIMNHDKLILYSILIFLVTLFVALTYRLYCYKNFSESKFKFYKDKVYFKELLAYSGWNLFGNIAAVSKGQGINLVLNVFFGTVINATYGITMQVQAAVSVFVNNFQLAVNPQIIKQYSKGDLGQTHKLIFQSSKFSFFLMLLIVTPILMNTQYVLEFWLKNPPEYTKIFVQLCLINILIDCISGPLMIGAQATGNIKWYQIVVGALVFLNLPISYFVINYTNTASNIFIVSIIISLISLQFRLFFLKKVLEFNVVSFYKKVIFPILLIVGINLVLFVFFDLENLKSDNLLSFMGFSIFVIFLLGVMILCLGIDKSERQIVNNMVKKILKR